MSRPLELADLARLANVSDPRISPDGARVAYVVGTVDLEANTAPSAIWLVDYDGGEPRRLTSGAQRDHSPRWSPRGDRLAFVSDRDGKAQLHLLDLAGGEARRLTNHPTAVSEPEWSPDGTRIAFVADAEAPEPDPKRRVTHITSLRHKHDGEGFRIDIHRHLWLVDIETGAVEQLTEGPYDDGHAAWSPDGRSLAFVSDRSPDREHHYEGGALHVIDLASKEVRRLTAENGRAAHPSWSPDGRLIAYAGADEADTAGPADLELRVVAADGSEAPRSLTAALGRSVGMRPGGYLAPSPPAWAGPDGPLCYLVGTGGATHLWRIGLDGAMERLHEGALAVSTFTAAGDRFALLVSDAVTPPEVWTYDERRGARSLTRTNAGLLDELTLDGPERMEFPAGVEGWLLMPAKPNGALVLSVHGGPHNYFGDAFNFDHHLYAARGWAVLYINPRGSGGYGEAFARRVIADWGGGDFADQLAAVDHVIAAKPIDPKRIAIVGSSYGGFMACWAVTQTDRFAVAVAGACISNLVSFYGTSDIGASWGMREFGGPPHERLDWYREHSPVTHAARVRTPLLLYHGEDDLRCPIEQSEQMFTTLRALGREVELVRLPEETHAALGSGSPVHRVEARRIILEWLERYLNT